MSDAVKMLQNAAEIVGHARARGFELPDSQGAIAAIETVERLRRATAALAADLEHALDESGVFRDDGHSSAKAMTRHVGRLAPSEAASRGRGARMGRELPVVAAALAAGTIGLDQYGLLGRVHANPRVRQFMADAQDWFLRTAQRLSYRDFELAVRQWERLADADGPEPANSRRHDGRNASFAHDQFDLGWMLKGSFASIQGASMNEVHEHYVDAERLADWEKAKAEHGDAATAAHLPRTEQQRRADALWQIFQDAAGAPGSAVPPGFVHNIVWDAPTYEQMLRRLDGRVPERSERGPGCADPGRYRCETIDGVPLEPLEAAASSLVDKVRRVVVDAAGVVIDLGRARAFTGGARTAVQLSTPHCAWPGCSVPTTHCEIDHSHDHAKGGRTCPGNGGPFCGRHNRWKQKGFTVARDPTGRLHVHRPDGTEIE